MTKTRVYCDASISPATMDHAQTSRTTTKLVGRIVIFIPQLDYGYIEQVKDGLTTKDGNPASTYLEQIAIEKAETISKEKGLTEFVIYSDCKGAIDNTDSTNAKWLPEGEFDPPSAFLHRILKRAQYLRKSSRKITKRAPLTPIQKEIFKLFQTERLEIKLSQSLVWEKIQADISAP
ncbi:MAG: hypothetical protein FJ358_03545 [Thaumarchaeota archaeon]|nr:hypothetical protein [Nitrososphaerota archaeon]